MATYSSIPAWKNSMGRGAWQATVHEVAKNWAQLSMQTPLHANEQIQTNSDYPFLFFKWVLGDYVFQYIGLFSSKLSNYKYWIIHDSILLFLMCMDGIISDQNIFISDISNFFFS